MERERIIVALDFSNLEEAKTMIEKLGDSIVFYKVGLELFLNSKGEILDYLNKKNKKIFLDLKFHDIPNTTAMASIFAAKKNIEIFNIHASGGKNMMRKVVSEAKKINKNILAIGVTILTSFSEEELKETFRSNLTLKELALNLAKLAKESGMDGVVCSPWEARDIKNILGKDFKIIAPGVRPRWSAANDQERIMTPKNAIENGCDYLVIGRPITKNENPKVAVQMILDEIKEAKI